MYITKQGILFFTGEYPYSVTPTATPTPTPTVTPTPTSSFGEMTVLFESSLLPASSVDVGPVEITEFDDVELRLVNSGPVLLDVLSVSVSGTEFDDVSAIGLSALSAEGGYTNLTLRYTPSVSANYIEFPLTVHRSRRAQGSTTTHSEMNRGVVRMYDSGTIHFRGVSIWTKVGPGFTPSMVWIGSTSAIGDYVQMSAGVNQQQSDGSTYTIIDTPFDWVYRPTTGKSVHFLLSNHNKVGFEDRRNLISYPNGVFLPNAFACAETSLSSGGRIYGTLTNTGSAIQLSGHAYATGTSRTILLRTYRVSVVGDPAVSSNWTLDNLVTHLSTTTDSLGFSYTQAFPASGYGIYVTMAISNTSTSQEVARWSAGPFYQDPPAIQNGVDPYHVRSYAPWPQDY